MVPSTLFGPRSKLKHNRIQPLMVYSSPAAPGDILAAAAQISSIDLPDA
jgi:hypothetical protein